MAERFPPITGIAMPSMWELFRGFFGVGINGFGGVMPFARRMLVEQRKWLTPDEFIDALAMCQFVPGPNIVNLAVALGARFHGPLGSVSAVVGILAAPITIVLIAYNLLVQVAEAPVAIGAIRGMSAVAAGLIVALAVKVGTSLVIKRDWFGVGFAAAAAISVGVLNLPLLPSLGVLAPLAITAYWWRK